VLETPIIYQISEGRLTASNFFDQLPEFLASARTAADAGVSAFQIREKRLSARWLFELSVRTADILRGSATKLLVNDRADIAVAAGAAGVHLTAHSIATSVVRRAFPNLFVAVSTHTKDEAVDAGRGGADLLVFGPVFETPGKGAAVGLDALREVVRAVAPVPVAGLGGIDYANHRDVLAVASGIAAIRGLQDPALIAELKRLKS
jgi:thiamine-phosphate pyrophosphorylase